MGANKSKVRGSIGKILPALISRHDKFTVTCYLFTALSSAVKYASYIPCEFRDIICHIKY